MTHKERIAHLQSLLADKRRILESLSKPQPVITHEYPTYTLVRVGAYEQPMLRRAS